MHMVAWGDRARFEQGKIMQRLIRAVYSSHTIRVYQAYNMTIAQNAVSAQSFVEPFDLNRMSWIKPSFFWMMHRSGWCTKKDQERVLAIDIKRERFENALRRACLTHFDQELYLSRDQWIDEKSRSEVLVQFDPERNAELNRLDSRTIQVGLAGKALLAYSSDWIERIQDITDFCKELKAYIESHGAGEHMLSVPDEVVYPTPPDICRRLGILQTT